MKTLKTIYFGLGICLFFAFTEKKSKLLKKSFLLQSVISSPDTINYDGMFRTYQSSIIGAQNNLLPYMNFTFAGFYNNNTSSEGFNSLFQVDSVSINDSSLFFNKPAYLDTNFIAYVTPIKWRVAGGQFFPSFTFINTDSFPTYLGYNLLPDTLVSTQDISITINNYSNAEKVQVVLRNGDNRQIIKKDVDSSGLVTFTQSEDLVGFYTQNTQLSIQVCLSNYNPQVISGKKIQFINSYGLIKKIVLVNNSISSRVKK